MKNKGFKIILIILLSLVAIALVGFLCLVLTGRTKFVKGFNYKLSENELYNEIIDEEFKKIYITSTASEIEVNKSEDNNYKVIVYGEKNEKLNVSKNNGILKVNYKQKNCVGFCFNNKINKIGKIEVYVPENYENTINVVNNYGDIIITDLKNATIDVEEDAGNVNIKEAKNVTVKNDYGNIVIDKAEIIDIDESAGDIKIGEALKVDAENNYGDIKINTINKSVKIKVDCGDVDIKNLYITENSSIKNNLGSIKIGNTNEIFINAKTDLGDVKINKNYKDSDTKLSIKNACGDIKVNN